MSTVLSIGGVKVDDLPRFDETVVKIDAWYDRHTRDWCIQKLNSDGCQVGDSIRVGTKADRDNVVKSLREEYGI